MNEPLNAEIDLLAASPDELTALHATLAGRDAFTRYGIDRPPFLSSLSFKVGTGKDGRPALLVHSSEAIPEPFVTFLVEVNWARGRLMREYTVLLDPPVYTPGERANSAAPVAAAAAPESAAVTAAAAVRAAPPAAPPAGVATPGVATPGVTTPGVTTPVPAAAGPTASRSGGSIGAGSSYRVARGDTLLNIARNMGASTPAQLDQTMVALFRTNPHAFDANINVLHRGAILRVPGADEIAALNQREAISEVRRQMDAWRGGAAAESGHLRLVAPSGSGNGSASGSGAGTGSPAAGGPDTAVLKNRVRELESQLAESRRLLDVQNRELAELQHKLGSLAAGAVASGAARTAANPPVAPAAQPAAAPPPPPPTAVTAPPQTVTPPPTAPKPAAATPAPDTGSWLDWISSNLWVPGAVIAALLAALGFAAWRRRQRDESGEFGALAASDVANRREPGAKVAVRRGDDSFLVEETGAHKMVPEPMVMPERSSDPAAGSKSADDTMSSESAVNLDQGDPLAEADFHMAYGLYDQAADLVRIALDREPDRRDLRLKLLEIYFVWGNKDAFLQTAKSLESTRDRAPAGEWDKIVIMGKQICPDDPMFARAPGAGRGAGALVDLNLEGGENRVDIDLFGDPEGERSSLDFPLAKEGGGKSGDRSNAKGGAELDFMLDAPERGADDSPTREMPPRDEPTVESEMMNFADVPTTESPMLGPGSSKAPVSSDQTTAEVAITDLGLDLDSLEQTGSASASLGPLEDTDHPSDAPTMVAGLDERSRRMMADAEAQARERDMTELERELEASFISELDSSSDDGKTNILAPESAPTVQMPREPDAGATSRFKTSGIVDPQDPDRQDADATSKLRGMSGDSIDLDLDKLSSALGGGDTIEQPHSETDLFSNEVFEATTKTKLIDLDVGDTMNGVDQATTRTQAQNGTAKLDHDELALPEFEPVTMSEVGTKLDLARAYMDMGDPEGARSILDEVVQEGSASQKQEAQRLIESLPG